MNNLFSTKFIALIVLILFAFSSNGKSEETIYSKFRPSNAGTDFWLALPPPYLKNAQGDFFKIYVTSDVETDVTLEIPGTGKYLQKRTLANDVIVFDLLFSEALPFNYACCNNETPPAQVYEGRGIHVFSDDPITVYAVVRIKATSDGYLAIPTSAMGTEYIATPYTSRPFNGINSLPNMVTLVAAYDGTKITMTLGGVDENTSVNVQGKGEIWPGEEAEFRLDAGDVAVVPTIATKENQTIAGTYFEGTKPFGLISGHFCADIPTDIRACDYNVEMDIPMHTWGEHYFVPKIQNRDHSGLLRIFAKEDNTTIYKDGNVFASLPQGRGGLQNEGWLETRVWPRKYDNDAPKIALYSADNPISVMYYNPSAQDDDGGANSDPFAMAITPVEQFKHEIIFATPASSGGQGLNGFEENYLMMVYETEDSYGAPPDDLEWGVVGKTETVWKKLSTVFSGQTVKYHTLDGAGGSDEIDWDTPLDGKIYGHLNIELPGDGVYGVRSVGSKHKFAVYAYGYDEWDSYGWPTSTHLMNIEKIEDQAPPEVTVGQNNCIGSEFVGAVSDFIEDESNTSGFYELILNNNNSTNFKLTTTIISNRQYNAIYPWSAEVEDISKEASAEIIFVDWAGNITTETIEYTPQNIVFAESEDVGNDGGNYSDFGLFMGEDPITRIFKIENKNDLPLEFTDVNLKYGDKGFVILNKDDFPLTLDTGEMAEILVEFRTSLWGEYSDEIGFAICASEGFAYGIDIVATSGNAVMSVADITFDIYDVDFGDIENNETVYENIVVENKTCEIDDVIYESYAPLVLTGFTSTLDEDFDLSKIEDAFELGEGEIEIEAGGEYSFSLGFKPSQTKEYSGKISFEYQDGTEACSDESGVLAKSISTSVKQSWPNDWTLSPNPTPGKLKVNNLENGKYEVYVYNTNSALLISISLNVFSGSLDIDASELSAAVYFLELKKDGVSYKTKFIKE